LAAASTGNAVLEGDDSPSADTATVTVILGNYLQISRNVPAVTNTQQAVIHARRDDEMAYQEMLNGPRTQARHGEYCSFQPEEGAGGDASKRNTAAVLSWIKTNTVKGSGGCDPASADGNDVRADGTQVAFTEANLKTVVKAIFDAGGRPDTIMAGSFNKQVLSTFTGRSTPVEQATSRTIVAAVDTYESDFGRMKVVPNRFQRSRDVLVLEMDKWAIAYLKGRRLVSIPLAITGDNQRRMIVSEYTVVSPQPGSFWCGLRQHDFVVCAWGREQSRPLFFRGDYG
jgi:hypothetical protein